MKKLPGLVFSGLAVATVAAFFITQHLKVTTPLVTGIWSPTPWTLNPVSGPPCMGVPARHTRISFYLLNRSDYVDVNIVSQDGDVVRTLASHRYMRARPAVRAYYFWDGRIGGRPAPDGNYFVDVTLEQQSRTVRLSNEAGPLPITIKTSLPRPVVGLVTPTVIPRTGGSMVVDVHFQGNGLRSATVLIYRTDEPSGPHLVGSFMTKWAASEAIWNGRVQGRPAPAGTYLIGLRVTDAACDSARFPARLPPAHGTTPHAGVTVRYLAAAPSALPVPAGSSARVRIDAVAPIEWTLRSAAGGPLLASGSQSPGGAALDGATAVAVPAGVSGLYQLSLRSGEHTTAVPLVAATPAFASVLVALPSLTWQGLNPVDDTGDGLPATLVAGGPVALTRPYAVGLPAGVAGEAGLLAYLQQAAVRYQLTTDVGLIEGVGPGLSGHRVVVLAGSERWITAALASELRAYVAAGGRVISLGIDSLRRLVTVSGDTASHPTSPAGTDALGARPSPLRSNPGPITVISDRLGIFSRFRGSLPGFGVYQPLSPAGTGAASQAGARRSAAAIVGYRLGHGVVVDIGLPGFGSALALQPQARRLLGSILSALTR